MKLIIGQGLAIAGGLLWLVVISSLLLGVPAEQLGGQTVASFVLMSVGLVIWGWWARGN